MIALRYNHFVGKKLIRRRTVAWWHHSNLVVHWMKYYTQRLHNSHDVGPSRRLTAVATLSNCEGGVDYGMHREF